MSNTSGSKQSAVEAAAEKEAGVLEAWGRRLAFALRFFTRFPLPVKVRIQPGDIPKSTVLFPLAGVFEGLFVVLAGVVGAQIADGLVPVLFLLAARMIISRGQIKGMAHAFDGLASTRDRIRMVEIMFDNRFGTMGVTAISFDYLLKFSLYFELLSRMGLRSAIPILICTCFAGKLCEVTGIATSGSVFGVDKLIDEANIGYLAASAVMTYLFAALLLGWVTAGLVLLVEISLGLIVSGLIVIKLGGLTKQTLGVMHEAGEIVLLFILLVW